MHQAVTLNLSDIAYRAGLEASDLYKQHPTAYALLPIAFGAPALSRRNSPNLASAVQQCSTAHRTAFWTPCLGTHGCLKGSAAGALRRSTHPDSRAGARVG